ncbi:transcriptional regulator [Vibrio sp. 99-8-1]|uniref:winged helix-turn-helix domain-containing protein n=1 Tax=Vibrio sp. 99-8-1 TaxID=2607602 RepID=UPI0014937BE3|nr:transcriptional regulator [Vibrio sp. 99-8-1]NOI67723.1 transcriptional regulator [Vibrio sp. 99-8-1]
MSSIGTKFVIAQRYIFNPNNNSLVDQKENNNVTRLGSNESRILLMLSERPNQVISRDELHEFVWRDQGFQVDDSSLTQAISTLRKLLNDSTKAPQYVKTVPKRGYQFIASVERSVPLSSGEENVNDTETSDNSQTEKPHVGDHKNDTTQDSSLLEKPSSQVESHPTAQIEDKRPPVNVAKNPKSKMPIMILLVALMLPITMLLALDPSPSSFRLVETVKGIPVKTTENHPPLDDWQPLIHDCVQAYISSNKAKPVEVIATTGPRSNFILNYVYSEEHSIENETIQLVANQKEIAKLCQ